MSTIEERDIKKLLFGLISVTTIIKIFIAATLELSVDEVYYWTYALYPDWSHFDHPPMVGWIIQLFSFNLLFDSELALRFGAIFISGINTYVIYSIGKSLPAKHEGTKNALTGLYAAMLFNASIYASVLAGNFIIPDTPQLLFWLLSLKFLLKSLPKKEIDIVTVRHFLLACLFAGMSVISKYHGVFIWAGIGLYVLLYNRNWLRSPYFYLGAIISALFVMPIIVWNIQNDWISFNFHSDRVANELIIRMDYLLTELFGQIAYNNPINYVLIVIALIATYKGNLALDADSIKILLLNSFPIWITFTSFAIFRQTLPHWTGPAFTPLILIAAVNLSNKTSTKPVVKRKQLFPVALKSSLFLLYGLLFAAWILINYYPGTIGETNNLSKYGDKDFTLDMFGWDQIGNQFKAIVKDDSASNSMTTNTPIISPKYFPGTEIDYYVAKPLGMKVLQYGTLSDIHKYAWINIQRGHLQPGEDAYMISTSNWYKDPFEYYSENFDAIIPTDTIKVVRSGETAYFAFIYHMKRYKGNFPDPFINR